MIDSTSPPEQPAGDILDSARIDKLAYYLLRSLNKAVRCYDLLADGDRILVALSGGKDSLTLLDLLRRRQSRGRDRFTLVAGHVRSDFHCGRAAPTEWLRLRCQTWGIPLVVDDMQVAEELMTTDKSRCHRCAWNRRKVLFRMAERMACNKIAFGHHADDVVETAMMNLLYNARIGGMDARLDLFDGRLTVIRPLVLTEERDIVPYARASGFPIQGEPCPEGLTSRRALVRRLLSEVGREHHDVKRSIYAALSRYGAEMRRANRQEA
jgi:tRNA(Ile)-lysidine synthase TilS/MesJ